MERVGQLSEILVTADGYILDGRARLEFAKELNVQPRIRYLTMHSCIGELPPGYDRDWEMEQVRDVIEETGRGKWQNSLNRREADCGSANQAKDCGSTNHAKDCGSTNRAEDCGSTNHAKDCGSTNHAKDCGSRVGLSPDSFKGVPCDGRQLMVRLPTALAEHLELMTVKTLTARKHGKGQIKVASMPEYIRRLCWQDFINHLPDTP
jgi:hypothetical protein